MSIKEQTLFYAAAASTAIAGIIHLMLNVINDTDGYHGTFNVVIKGN